MGVENKRNALRVHIRVVGEKPEGEEGAILLKSNPLALAEKEATLDTIPQKKKPTVKSAFVISDYNYSSVTSSTVFFLR